MKNNFAKVVTWLTPLLLVSCVTTEEEKESVALKTTDGFAIVETYQTSGTIAAIDPQTRKLMIKLANERFAMVTAVPGVVNFSSIRVNDYVNLTVTEELAVFMSKTESPLILSGVVVAPAGNQGGVIAQTTQARATIAAIDVPLRKVVLSMPDGTSKTVKAGTGVDLSELKPSDRVTVQLTEALALTAELARNPESGSN